MFKALTDRDKLIIKLVLMCGGIYLYTTLVVLFAEKIYDIIF